MRTVFFSFLFFFIEFLVNIRLNFRHIPDQPPPPPAIVRRSSSSLLNTQRDLTPLKKSQRTVPFVSHSSVDQLSDNRSQISSIDIPSSNSSLVCPLCRIPFDTAGSHRPVSDACGHTTCFQCFKAIMIKATGCTLCQKEEEEEQENNPRLTNDSVSVQLNDSSNTKFIFRVLKNIIHRKIIRILKMLCLMIGH